MDFYILRPRASGALPPALIFLHGGGWVLGDLQTHKRLVQDLALAVGCAIVFPEYPRAPEATFPATVESTFAFLQWLAAHGAILNLDTSRLALAGDSSGGNLAAVMAVLATSVVDPQFDSRRFSIQSQTATLRGKATLNLDPASFWTRISWSGSGSNTFPIQRAEPIHAPAHCALP